MNFRIKACLVLIVAYCIVLTGYVRHLRGEYVTKAEYDGNSRTDDARWSQEADDDEEMTENVDRLEQKVESLECIVMRMKDSVRVSSPNVTIMIRNK